MPFCPQCGYEYRANIEICPECNQRLVADPPPQPQFSREALVEVYEAPNASLADTVQEALEEAGIRVMEDVFQHPFTPEGLEVGTKSSYGRLLVLESRAPEAKEIIADFVAAYDRGDLSLPEEKTEPSPHRASIVLTLGILGLVLWPYYVGVIPGLIAWILGNKDLEEMRKGNMDPSGRDMVITGRLCGKMAALIGIVVILMTLLLPPIHVGPLR